MKKNIFIISVILFLFTTIIFAQKSENNEFSAQLDLIHQSTYERRDSIGKCFRLYFDEIKKTNDTLLISAIDNKINSLYVLDDANNDFELNLELDFIEKNIEDINSLMLLKSKIKRQEGTRLFERIETVFNKFSLDIRNSQKGNEIASIIKNHNLSKVGVITPNFISLDIKSNEINLYTIYKSKKLVLIDFWASWCAPCVDEFDGLKKIYNEFKNCGCEIIALSEDKDFTKWENAIKKYDIQGWIHINTTNSEVNFAELFFRNSIPTLILIDNNGEIIARWRGGGKENKLQIKKTIEGYFENPH